MLIYILLGILQGIFEWVPISSEGIVALASQLFLPGKNPVDIALFLHLGTFFAILVYFRKDWKDVLTLKNPKLLRFLIIATIVSLVIGFPLYTLVREVAVGTMLLIIMGLGLLLTSYFHSSKRTFGTTVNKLAIIAGFLQGLAVIPGLGFDKSLNRLGYGGGFYDRILTHIPEEIKKIAFCFDIQVVEKIPVMEHDIKIDVLITESRIYRR